MEVFKAWRTTTNRDIRFKALPLAVNPIQRVSACEESESNEAMKNSLEFMEEIEKDTLVL